MTDAEWVAWVKHYGAVLALGSEADRAMLAAWKLEFMSYAKADMDEAFRRLANSDQILRYRADHRRFLHVLLNEIQRERVNVVSQEIEEAEERYRCKDCYGTGRVIGPHPRAIKGGVWDFKTVIAVSCSCALGANRALRFNAQAVAHDSPSLHDVAWLDFQVENWRGLMAEKAWRQKQALRADDLTRDADKQGHVRLNRELYKQAAKGSAV